MSLCISVCAQSNLDMSSASRQRCRDTNCIATPTSPEANRMEDTRPASSTDGQRRGVEEQPSQPDENPSLDSGSPQMQPGTNRPSWSRFQSQPFQHPPLQEEETEFQKFVYSSTGQHLPLYGHALFRNVPSTFAPLDQIPVPAGYSVGPGDELLIRVWGQIELNARIMVDRNGQIYLPKIGAIAVAGVRYDQLNRYLTNAISRIFKNFDLNVNLGQLRSIQIFVVGQACSPGTYTVSSLSTLVNALFAAGGPAAGGSMRRIQLKRENAVVSEFDFYDLLVKGDKSKDAALLPGDVIYIPPVGRLVAVTAGVNSPAIYEVREDTTVRQQIEVAGGLSTTADGSRALLERIDQRRSRRVEEFPLDDGGLSRPLQDGDVLRIFAVSPRFENAVTLRGNVARPGRYPWRSGMRIRDLLPAREAIITRDYWMRQNALDRTAPGWPDSPRGNRDELRPNAAENPGDASARPGTPNEIRRNSAEINWDYAMVQRLDPDDLSSRLLPFNLGHAIADAASPDNLPLEAGDVITIFSQTDLAVPFEKRTKVVWIEGEVNAPGAYRAGPGETLRDLVARAGGLTSRAYLFASDFRRESTRAEQQKQLDKMIDEMDKELRSRTIVLATRASEEDRLAGQEQIAAQRSQLERLRQTQATGRIVLDLQPSDVQASALPLILRLEDGDRLFIPDRPATVEVAGNVYNQSSFIYKPGKSVRDYVEEAGGGTRTADRGRLFVIRADGSVLSKQMHRSLWAGNFDSLQLRPGDTVVMPERIRTTSVLRELRDWSQVFAQFALGAAAIRVISP